MISQAARFTLRTLQGDASIVARQEHAREDLLAEAAALVERIEIVRQDGGQHVVLGFRRDGAASVYFDEDPAYHFNSRHELRRAYLDGQLLKAESGRLISITRKRTADRVQLTSRELDVAETSELLGSLQRRLALTFARIGCRSLPSRGPSTSGVRRPRSRAKFARQTGRRDRCRSVAARRLMPQQHFDALIPIAQPQWSDPILSIE